jgi:hypothetical protein
MTKSEAKPAIAAVNELFSTSPDGGDVPRNVEKGGAALLALSP